LGINRTSHLSGWVLIEDMSELFDTDDESGVGLKPLHVSNISCGRRHCMATFDYGSFFFWGDNEHGQLGNRKRAYCESPYPKRKFELHHNVENVICDIDSSCVIVETPAEPNEKEKAKRAKRKAKKREITLAEIATSEDEIRARNEQRLK